MTNNDTTAVQNPTTTRENDDAYSLDDPPGDSSAQTSELAGVSPKNGPHGEGPLSAAWISDALLHRTRAVWSAVAGRDVSADEAVEILINVKNLAEFLLDRTRDANEEAADTSGGNTKDEVNV